MDKQELAELLAGIIAESYSRPPTFISPICNKCKHHKKGTPTCTVYPQGIPRAILARKEDCEEIVLV